jgi:hypothetical protein
MSDSDSDFDEEDILEYERNRKEEIKSIQKPIQKYTQHSPNIFISGPNKLFILQKGEQVIRLFGEWHGNEDNCDDQVQLRGKRILTIIDYIEDILKKGDVDLYLETPLLHLQSKQSIKEFYDQVEMMKKYKRDIPYLVLTRDRLKWCLNPSDRDKCFFRNSRVHSTDIRPFYVYADIMRKMRIKMTQNEWDNFRFSHKNLINVLSNIKNCNDYTGYIMSLLDKNIIKQMEKSGITGKKLKNLIFKTCEEHNAVMYVKKFVLLFSYNIPPNGSMFDQEISDIIQEQISVLHDIYTVLRMIKPMNGKIQKNIVFYGGNAHVDNLITMLKFLDFKIIPNNSKEISKRCLQLN